MALDVRTQITVIEQALRDILELGLAQRLPAVANLSALAAAGTETTQDRALRYVTDQARIYRWNMASTAAHSSPNVIMPSTSPANGRWLRVTHAGTFGPNSNAPLHARTTGYVPFIDLYQGAADLEQKMAYASAQTPAVLIHWVGDNPQVRSEFQGALYWNVHEFTVECMSSCLRHAPSTTHGSPIAAEAALDPGLYRLMGDVRYLLAGAVTGVEGVDSIEIGASGVVDEDVEQRIHIGEVRISVRSSFGISDEDLVDMVLQADPQFPSGDAEDEDEFDPLNYVASGYRASVGSGLTRSWGVGVAFIAGATVTSTPTAKTFTASKDTYRDLNPDGTFTYIEADVDAEAPDVTAGALRVGVTRTDASAITADRLLCSHAYDHDSFGAMTIEGE